MAENATYEELAHRTSDGVDVWLLWSKEEDRLAVQVSDAKSGDFFEVEAKSDRGLDVFHHPYAYAAAQGIGYSVADGVVESVEVELDRVVLRGF